MFWTVLILFIVCVNNGTCESPDSFLAKHYESGNYFCVTNSSYALSWVDDNEENPEILFQQSQYYPPSRLYSSNMNFVNSIWTKSSYLFWKHNNGDPILDSRWEALKIYKTEYVNGDKKKLKYYNILNLKQQNFKIPISIRIKYEAHIFLCNGNKPSTSDCYWFMLQGNHGNVTALRKCNKYKIPDQQNVWPQDDCKIHRTNVTHPHQQPHYLSHKKWSHFVISKKDNTLTFFDQHDKTKPLLEWQDTKDPIDVTNLIIQSKIVNGLWKIHDVNFLYTETATEEVQLGPSITISDKNSFCLSMFISMCSTCILRLSLTKNNEVLNNQEYYAKHSSWNEIKFITYNTKDKDEVNLVVSTFSTYAKNNFWAISQIRNCKPNEVRGIGPTQSVICQLMTPINPIIYYKDITLSNEVLNSQCAEDSIGQFCVPCNLIFEDCQRISVCTEKRCICSAGYRGDQCFHECGWGFYGPGCNNLCGNCYTKYCNHIDGTCRYQGFGCKENYSGAKCNISPAVTFTYPPKILAVSFTEAKVQVSNFKIRHSLDDSTPTKYAIQYRATHGTDNTWNDTKEEIPFGTARIFKLQNLTPETMYSVRSVIIANDKQQINLLVPTSNFTTKCTEIEPKNIIIKASNMTAKITITKNTRYSCKSYTAYLFQQGMTQEFRDSTAQFTNLKPFTVYKLIIERNNTEFKKIFKTTETTPGEIMDALVYTKNNTSVSIRWKPPFPLNGILAKYKIKIWYKNDRLKSEKIKEITPLSCKLWPEFHCATIEELKTNQYYEVEISARNQNLEAYGEAETLSTLTAIGKSKAPYNLKLSWSLSNDLELQWSHPNETNGDVNFFVISSYLEKTLRFCKQLNITENSYNLTYHDTINASEFVPTTEYSISVFANNGIDGEAVQRIIFSPPDVPSLKKETEYNSTNDSISITMFPFKPRGQSDKFKLFVFLSGTFEKCNININCLEESRIIFCDFSNELEPKPVLLLLGKSKEPISSNCKLNYITIKPATSYNITLILLNSYKNESRYKIYNKIYKTKSNPLSVGNNYYLLILLLFPLSGIIFIIQFFRKKYTNVINNGSNNKVSVNLDIESASEKKSSKSFYSEKSNQFLKEYSDGTVKQNYEVLLDSMTTYLSIDTYLFQYVTMEYIATLNVKNCYILATMPYKTKLTEFWNMIWKEKVLNIALLDDLQKINQCYTIYWPKNENDEIQFDNITIKHITSVQNESYIIRKFRMLNNNRVREVEQIHLKSSAHKSKYISSSSFIHFFKKMTQIPISHKLPLLIQSGSKSDIAGFAMLCDVSVRLAKKEDFDILKNLEEIVKGIPEVMISFDQFLLAHSVVLDTLLHINTSLICNVYDSNQKTLYPAEEVEAQIEYLRDTEQFDKIQLQREECHSYCNVANLDQDDDVTIALYQIEKDVLYNTITVDSPNNDKKFLLTSQPTEDRLDDFINLLQQTKITLILSFDHNVTLWPSRLRPILTSKNVSLQYVESKRTQNYDWITIQLSNEKVPDSSFTIAILSMKHWPSQYGYFPKIDSFVNFCIETKRMVKENNKVLVICRDGITASGIFVVMYYNVEKICSEDISDVCTTVRKFVVTVNIL